MMIRWVFCGALCASLAACQSQPSEPVPPPARYELVIAPPGARGARAAGTDAAPPLPTELGPAANREKADDEDDEPDAGEADSGAIEPEAEGGVTL